jgi:hypothetical protein
MCVPGCQRKIKLAGHGSYPNVIVWDNLADTGEFGLHLAVPLSGTLIRQKKGGGLQKLAN